MEPSLTSLLPADGIAAGVSEASKTRCHYYQSHRLGLNLIATKLAIRQGNNNSPRRIRFWYRLESVPNPQPVLGEWGQSSEQRQGYTTDGIAAGASPNQSPQD